MTNIKAVTNERGNRYGSFKDGSNLVQRLKEVMWSAAGYTRLEYDQREALEMIQHKIARIINGDPSYQDSWIDIAGYSSLVVERLKEDEESTLSGNEGACGLSKCGAGTVTGLYIRPEPMAKQFFFGSPHGDEEQN